MVARRPHGVSLIELLVGAILLGGVMYALFTVFTQANRGVNQSVRNADMRSAMLQVSADLQKFVATGDSRFFAFSGLGPGDRTLARVLVPFAGACADLSAAGCADDTGLLYTHYDKSLSPAVSAICFFDPAAPTLLIDLQNPTYGPATAVTGGFNLGPGAGGNAVGRVAVSADALLGLMNPPRVTLWRALDKPTKLTITVNPDNSLTPPLPADCVSRLQGPTQVASLYTVPVAPLLLTQFTTGAAFTSQEMVDSAGPFPMRLFNGHLRALGHMPGPNEKSRLAVNDCTAPGGVIGCAKELNRVPGVARVRVDHAFKLVLGAGAGAQRYEVLGAAQTASASCQAPACSALPLPAASLAVTLPITLPGGTTGPETFEQLSDTAFSLLKEEVISRLKVRVTLMVDIGQRRGVAVVADKEDGFDVVFP